MSVKSILLKNNGLILQPKRWALADQESGSQVLEKHSESNYSNPSTVAEVEEGLRVWATILSRIRAWSYEGWALVNAMGDISYFLTVCSSETEALKLTKNAVNTVFQRNVSRACQGSFPCTYNVSAVSILHDIHSYILLFRK